MPDPHEVLDGKTPITALELIRLIHRVNPTGRKMEVHETAERYRLKARLQSLLIRRFKEGLRVELPTAENPDLVGLRLSRFDEDACHALIRELDEDAASWLRRRIDEEEGVADAHAGDRREFLEARDPATGNGLSEEMGLPLVDENLSADVCIRMGRKALDIYDYDACEKYFRSALRISGGRVEAAVGLLELYVDHLGVYEKALEVSEDFPSGTLRDEMVRLLMGLASVHCGHFEQATDYVDRISDPRVSDVYLAAARYYIEERAETLAAKALSKLKSYADVSQEADVQKLDRQLRLLRAEQVVPLKKDMAQAWEAGRLHEALDLAERILLILPDNPEARKVYHEVLKRQRRDRISELLREADDAGGCQAFAREVSLLAEAVSLGADKYELSERLKTARLNAAKQREETEIAEFRRLREEGGMEAALAEFVNFNEKKRKCFAVTFQDSHFCWLEKILSGDEISGRRKGVGAVMALGRAKKNLEAGENPKKVMEMLLPHADVLQFVPDARTLMHQAESLAQAVNFSENKALLLDAVRFLEKTHRDLGKAEQALSAVKTGYLDETDTQDLEVLKSRHKHLESLFMLKKQYTSAAARGDHFMCMDLAEKLGALDDDGVLEDWAGGMGIHVKAVKREWALQSFNIRDLPKAYGCMDMTWLGEGTNCLLLPNGRHVVLATSHDRWMFIRTFSIDDQGFREGIVFRMPQALYLPKLFWDGEMLWIFGDHGLVMALCLNPLMIRHCYDFSSLVAKDEVIEDTLIFPKERIVWLHRRDIRNRDESVEVIRWDQGRTVRTFRRSAPLIPVNRGDRLEVAMADSFQQTVRICAENGRTVQTFALEGPWLTDGIVPHPNGVDYVCLAYRDLDFDELPGDTLPEGDESDVPPLTVLAKPDLNKNIAPWVIEGSNGEFDCEMVKLHGADIIFVHFMTDEGNQWGLTALKPSNRGFDELYRVSVPKNFILVSNEHSDGLVAMGASPTGIYAVRLDHRLPCFERMGELEEMVSFFPAFNSFWDCDEETGDFKREILAAMLPPTEDRFLMYREQSKKIRQQNDPDRASVHIRVLNYSTLINEAKSLTAWLKQHHPDHCRVLMEAAKDAARKQDWSQVISVLERVALKDLDGGSACHGCHLLGMAYFATGDAEKALRIWKRGKRFKDGRCKLDPYIAYANLSLKNEDQRKRARLSANMKSGLALFETVDQFINEGEWRGVVLAMESAGVLQIKNMQLQARLTWAYLNQDLKPNDSRFICKILMLADFCEKYGEDFYRDNPILPYHLETWPESRLKEIVRKSKDWLNKLGG